MKNFCIIFLLVTACPAFGLAFETKITPNIPVGCDDYDGFIDSVRIVDQELKSTGVLQLDLLVTRWQCHRDVRKLRKRVAMIYPRMWAERAPWEWLEATSEVRMISKNVFHWVVSLSPRDLERNSKIEILLDSNRVTGGPSVFKRLWILDLSKPSVSIQ